MTWYRTVTLPALSAAWLSVAAAGPGEATGPEAVLAKPSPAQYTYQEQERIMFVCLDPCTWQGREYDNHTTDLKSMTLPRLDVDQWCRAATSWGAKQILFVARAAHYP